MTIDQWKVMGEKWKTTSSKTAVLFPALEKLMPDLNGKKVLDAGCGDGFGVAWLRAQGADSIGIDISEKGIESCKQRDPQGKYLVMDVRNVSFKEKFDYVLSLLVLLSFDNKPEISMAIKKMAACLKEDGKLIIATVHPAFDIVNDNMENLVRKSLGPYSYADSGLQIEYKHKNNDFSFIDFHWRMEDYSDCISEAGLVIEKIVEPLPIPESKKDSKELYSARRKYPPHILFVCRNK